MPIPTRAALKAYFETGDKPTQAQIAELIDAIYDLNQQTADNARAVAPVALVYATRVGTVWTIQRATSVDTVTHISTTATARVVRVTFSAALPDVNYIVTGSSDKTISTTSAATVLTAATGSFAASARTTGYCEIALPLSSAEISVAIYSP